MGLREARHRLAVASEEGDGKILVGLSGGKDSLTTLDLVLASGLFARVEAFFMYFVRGLRCVEAPVELAQRRHPGLVIHHVPHYALANALRGGLFRPHLNATADWRTTSIKDVEEQLRKKTGIEWLAYGHRMDESSQRRGMLKAIDGVDRNRRQVYPICDWHNKDVFAYLRMRHIPMPSTLGAMGTNSGMDLRASTLAWMAENHPDDYARVLEVFPYAGAQLARRAFYGDKAP